MSNTTRRDTSAQARDYLTRKISEIKYRIDARNVHGATRGMYGKSAILTLIDQVDGSLRLAYLLNLVRMGEDFYDDIRAALDDARKAVK